MKLKTLIFLLSITLSHWVFPQDSIKATIYFEIDSFNISELESIKLRSTFNKLKFDTIIDLRVTGYCDDTGEKEYNDSLSLERAQTVAQIINNNLMPNRLTSFSVVGGGQVQLRQSSGLPITEERALNRRVDFIMIYNQVSPPPLTEIKHPDTEQPEIIEIEKFDVGDTIRIYNILFHGGISKFRAESYVVLNNLLESLKTNKGYNIKIMGHINYTPGNPYKLPNRESRDLDTGKPLSEERAKAVFDYLVKNGIEESRLSYEGLGGMFPIINEDDKNMRVEIKILEK